MATISKESLAQFWLNAFPIVNQYEYLSFSNTTVVKNLLEFVSEKDEDKKMFEMINGHLQNTQPGRIIKNIDVKTSPKHRRSARNNTLINIDARRIKFTINIEVIDQMDMEEEITTVVDTKVEDRTIENLTSILNEFDSKVISQRFSTLIHAWLIDDSFNISNDLFSILIELMNKHPEEFFLQCFVPWLRNISTDHTNLFFSNLFTQLTNLSDRCKLCCYLCQNSTCPLNENELSIISKWFDSKEFYFSNDLLNILPEKVAFSARIYSDSLPFAKVLHKVLIKCTENNQIINNEQRLILKQAITINTTILSDILLDLLD